MPRKTAVESTKESAPSSNVAKQKQSRLPQTACPIYNIEESLIIPRALKDNFAGQPTAPILLAEACNISPTSSKWRILTGSSAAYGLTSGGYNSKTIALTDLGNRIVAPLIEGDDLIALKEAAMKPTILSDIYHQFDNNKLPRNEIAYNILSSKGVPKEKLSSTWDILKENAKKVNILRLISGNEYIYIDCSTNSSTTPSNIVDESLPTNNIEEDIPDELLEKMNITPPTPSSAPITLPKEKPSIFISHGKNSSIIVGQLKELILYGQMEPVVSIEREATAIPVPDKVFDDMRSCDAGIININLEEVSVGVEKFERLNENVLIEIGAAIALYGKRVILLCKKGTPLPSNLQGLYRCEYEGNQLDYSATMKLLKTMQELRGMM